MGQKLQEHPAVDYWVKLAKEADKAGAVLKRPRRAVDKQEWGKFQTMQRLRTRLVLGKPEPVIESLPLGDDCGKCGRPTVAGARRLWRQIYSRHGRTDIWVCGECGGVAHVASCRA